MDTRLEAENISLRARLADIQQLLNGASYGQGRIVSTSALTDLQIEEARVEGRLFVTDEMIGFVLLPWDLRTRHDKEREEARENAEVTRLKEANAVLKRFRRTCECDQLPPGHQPCFVCEHQDEINAAVND